MMKRIGFASASAVALAAAAGYCITAAAQQPPASTKATTSKPAANSEEAALKSAASQYLAALRNADRAALVASWTAEGDYIDAAGQRYKGRELVRHEALEKVSEAEMPSVETEGVTIRFIRPDVAIEDGVTLITGPSHQHAVSARYSAIWVKEEGKWLLDCVREFATEQITPPHPLDELDWMLGDWVGEARGLQIVASVRLIEDKQFIEREFSIKRGDQVVLHGRQTIGWDPAVQSIKSWSFDSQGGHSEGLWTHDDGTWTVDMTGVLPDGREILSTHTFKPNDDGTVTWTATSPDVPEVDRQKSEMIFKRQGK